MAIGDYPVPRAVDFDADTGWILVRPYVGEYTDPDPDDEPYRDDEPDPDDGPYADDEPDPDDEPYGEPEPTEAAEADTTALPLVPQTRHSVRPSRRSDDYGPPVGRHIIRPRGGGRSLVLLAAGVVVGLVAIAGGVVLATTGRSGGPGVATVDATRAGGGSRPGGTSVTGGASRPSDQSQPGDPSGTAGAARSGDPAAGAASPSALGATGSADTPPGSTQSPTDPGGSGSPSALPPTWSPPPAADITGPITNVAGLCLDDSDDRARLWNCDGTSSQTWTLAADGTLRLGGQCLQPGNGLVRLQGCDGSAAQQWRVGPAGSLVDPAAAACLGDPEVGANKGTPQRTAPCDQSDAQRWTLSGTGA